MLQIVVRVDRQPVLQNVDRVLRLLVLPRALLALHDHVRHAVAHQRRTACVALCHALGELYVRELDFVAAAVGGTPERLGNYEFWEVHAVCKQFADDAFGEGERRVDVAIDEELVETGLDEVAGQCAVVSAHGLFYFWGFYVFGGGLLHLKFIHKLEFSLKLKIAKKQSLQRMR